MRGEVEKSRLSVGQGDKRRRKKGLKKEKKKKKKERTALGDRFEGLKGGGGGSDGAWAESKGLERGGE